MATTSGKEVTLTIRAKDDASGALNNIEKAIRNIGKVDNQKGVLKLTQDIRKEAKQLETEFQQVNARIRQLMSQNYPRDSGPVQQEIARARELKTEIQQRQNAIGRLRILSRDASNENIRNLKAQQNAAIAAVVPLVNGTQEAVREQKALDAAVKQTTNSIVRQGVAARSSSAGAVGGGVLAGIRNRGNNLLESEVAAISTRNERGFLGLRPYELQNLSYQINDVITGLASGQRPMQVFAQQIGQIAQLLPNLVLGLGRFAATFGAPFIAMLPGIVRIQTFNNHVKEFTKTLQLNADAANYSIPRLAEFAQQLDDTGLSAKDARNAITALINEGIDPSRFASLIDTARGLSKALGIDMSEAIEKTVTSFTNGVDQVRELDQQLNFLTADQYSHIRALEEAGEQTEAVEYAQSILQRRMDEVERKAKGGWSQAWESLGDAFLAFSKLLANSRVTNFFMKEWDQFGKDIAQIAKEIEFAVNAIGDATTTTSDELREQISALRNELANDPNGRYDDFFNGGMNRRSDEERLADLERQLARQEAAEAAEEEAREQERIAEETERQAKAKLDIQQSIEEQIVKLREEAELANLTKREQYIQQQILEAQNRAKEKGIELDKEQLRLLREQSGATFDEQNSIINTGNFGSLTDRIIGVESGGNASARNPNSTATGLGQFIESTWLAMFRKYFPDRAESMSREAILALRENAAISRQMVELYARENAKILQDAGVAVNDAAVYLAHFLGPQGALNILQADRNTPVSNVLGADQIRANRSILAGRTAGQVIDWAGGKVGVSDQQIEIQKELTEEARKRAEEERKANEAIGDQLQQMQFELTLQDQTARQQAISTAVRQAELTAQKAGLELTKEQRAEVERLAAANFDRQNAEKIATEQYNQLLERRALLMQQAQTAQAEGEQTTFENLRIQLSEVDAQLLQAAEKAILFWESIGGPKADNAILKIRSTIAGLDQLNNKVLDGAEVNRQLADTGVQAMNQFGQAVAEGENVAGAFWDAMRQGIANFIIEITNAIARQMILNALTGGAGGGAGFGGFLAGVGNWFAGVNHEGGIAGGSGGARRTVNAGVFANAVRYHTGGIAGLKSNEVPSILKRGEEVLREDDPRHINNGGGAGGVNIKQVNVLDPAEIISAALQDEEGQRVLFNFVSRNSHKLNQSLNR